MKIICIALLLLSSVGSFANSIEEMKKTLEKKDFSLVERFITKFSHSSHCASPDEVTRREILKNYYEIVAPILLFMPTPEGKHVGKCNYYQLNIITKDNEIIKYDLYSKQFSEAALGNHKLLTQYSNEDQLMKLQELYHKNFYRTLDLNELFDNSITYGERCGWGGQNPEERDIIESYINITDHGTLFYWLTSPSFEKKLYAYEGYKILMNKGYIPSEKETTIIKGLKMFKGLVRRCSGCSYYREDFTAMIKQISNQKLDTVLSKKGNTTSVTKKVIDPFQNIAVKKSHNTNLLLTELILLALISIRLFHKERKKQTA